MSTKVIELTVLVDPQRTGQGIAGYSGWVEVFESMVAVHARIEEIMRTGLQLQDGTLIEPARLGYSIWPATSARVALKAAGVVFTNGDEAGVNLGGRSAAGAAEPAMES